MNDLKPCPFCGGTNIHIEYEADDYGNETWSYICCYDCLSSFFQQEACCADDKLHMAISALEAQEEKHSTESSSTHKALDTISRQAAIDAIVDCTVYENADDLKEAVMQENAWNKWSGGVLEALEAVEELPSAQPEPVRINLNEPIKVKLTDLGKEIYYHQYDRTNQIAGREICKPRFPREDENGYTEFQLWCFIELYGMHMGMTLPNVIEPLEIVYER